MKDSLVFITSDKKLDEIIKRLGVKLSMEDHNYLVYELYRHVDHTRKNAFRNGYDQGRFDETMDRY